MRILVPPTGEAPALGVEEGGLLSAEALLLARYFMFSQVYYHPIRVIYDIHLQRFLKEWLTGGQFSIEPDAHLELTDNEVTAAILEAARDETAEGNEWADRIISRRHFRILWSRNPADVRRNPDAGQAIAEAAATEFGEENVEHSKRVTGGGVGDFPVRLRDGRVESSVALSQTLESLPVSASEYVFVAPERLQDASAWLEQKREEILQTEEGEQ